VATTQAQPAQPRSPAVTDAEVAAGAAGIGSTLVTTTPVGLGTLALVKAAGVYADVVERMIEALAAFSRRRLGNVSVFLTEMLREEYPDRSVEELGGIVREELRREREFARRQRAR
jgi:hypothetical protein